MTFRPCERRGSGPAERVDAPRQYAARSPIPAAKLAVEPFADRCGTKEAANIRSRPNTHCR